MSEEYVATEIPTSEASDDGEADCGGADGSSSTSRDLNALALDLIAASALDWVKINYGTGSAGTVYPMEYESVQDSHEHSGNTYMAATGEVVDAGNRCVFTGCDEYNTQLKLKGERAPVHKILVSAGECTLKGNDTFLSENGSWIILRDTSVWREVRAAISKIAEKHQYAGMVPLYLERNVFNMYLRPDKTNAGKPLCPAEAASSSSGFPRRV